MINHWLTIPGYRCPSEDIAFGCRGPKECLYPNPDNCSSFIQCTDGGLAYVMPCAHGTQWNDHKKWCDWPKHSTCTREKITHPPITSPTPDPVLACPKEEDIAATDCKDCLYPHPDKCNYYQQVIIRKCPGDLQWNDADKKCDLLSHSTCGIGQRTPEPFTSIPAKK